MPVTSPGLLGFVLGTTAPCVLSPGHPWCGIHAVTALPGFSPPVRVRELGLQPVNWVTSPAQPSPLPPAVKIAIAVPCPEDPAPGSGKPSLPHCPHLRPDPPAPRSLTPAARPGRPGGVQALTPVRLWPVLFRSCSEAGLGLRLRPHPVRPRVASFLAGPALPPLPPPFPPGFPWKGGVGKVCGSAAPGKGSVWFWLCECLGFFFFQVSVSNWGSQQRAGSALPGQAQPHFPFPCQCPHPLLQPHLRPASLPTHQSWAERLGAPLCVIWGVGLPQPLAPLAEWQVFPSSPAS